MPVSTKMKAKKFAGKCKQARENVAADGLMEVRAQSPTPQKARILNLPTETSSRIYEDVTAVTKVIISGWRKRDGRGNFAIAWTKYPHPLLVCRKMYQDFQPVLTANLELKLAEYFVPVRDVPLVRYRCLHRLEDIPYCTKHAYLSNLQTIFIGSFSKSDRSLSFSSPMHVSEITGVGVHPPGTDHVLLVARGRERRRQATQARQRMRRWQRVRC